MSIFVSSICIESMVAPSDKDEVSASRHGAVTASIMTSGLPSNSLIVCDGAIGSKGVWG